MKRIRIYFMEITDIYEQKHLIKSDDCEKIWAFARRHKGEIKALHSGSKMVLEKKYLEMKKEENFK